MKSKNKICIVTTSKIDNYGAVLQNFALQTILEEKYCVETLNYKSKGLYNHNKIYFKGKFALAKKILYLLLYPNYLLIYLKRNIKFRIFRRKYINFTCFYSNKNIMKTNEEFDYFISGSDQVFNLNIFDGEKTTLLDFVHDNKKKKSYAASFGGTNEENIKKTLQYISQFSSLLIREIDSVKTLKEKFNINSTLVLDPTFLLDKDEWYKKLKLSKFKKPNKKYIITYLLKDDDNLIQGVKEFARSKKMEIFNLYSSINVIKIKGAKNICCGPREFVFYFMHCEYVFAASFHAIAFAINFNKKFFFRTDYNKINSSNRIGNLIYLFDLPRRDVIGGKIVDNPIDWEICNKNLSNLREFSKKILFECFSENNYNSIPFPHILTSKSNKNILKIGASCCGCGNCKTVCPKNAIAMKFDNEEFLYPEIDFKSCINCGKCCNVCPIINNFSIKNNGENFKTYHAALNNNNILQSTSGGVAQAIYRYCLANNIKTFGVAYNEDFYSCSYVEIKDIDSMNNCLQSKYLKSELENVAEKINKYLWGNDRVCFIGLPCEVAALKLMIKSNSDSLITVSLICHGPTSPLVYKQFFRENNLEPEQIKSLNVRYKGKTNQWGLKQIEITTILNQRLVFDKPSFYIGFNNIVRPSCYDCHYKFNKNNSDIIIGDFWGVNKKASYYNQGGNSCIICLTKKGQKFVNFLNVITLNMVTANEIFFKNPSLNKSILVSHNRKAFLNSISRKVGIRKSYKKTLSKIDKIKSIIPKKIKDFLRKI